MWKPELVNRLGKIRDNLLKDVFLEGRTAAVERALLLIATDNAVREEVPGIDVYAENYISAKDEADAIKRECALIELYSCLHAAGSMYSPYEKQVLEDRRGISCQPGGILPLIMAGEFIGPGSTVADLGAGNGLQGLLLQCISPHGKTLQIELSAGMVRMGGIYQRALGIGKDRVEWITGDIADSPIESADLIYLYRPAKPVEGGNKLYRSIADRLASGQGPLVVLSVADCLGRFLDKRFSVLYSDDNLTCFLRE